MKNLRITVNGKEYDVKVEEIGQSNEITSIIETNVSSEVKQIPKQESKVLDESETINSPMPGTIVSIKVKEGQKVSSGNVLVILEAMKMENEILAPKDGIVSRINVVEGQSVDSGTILISLQ